MVTSAYQKCDQLEALQALLHAKRMCNLRKILKVTLAWIRRKETKLTVSPKLAKNQKSRSKQENCHSLAFIH